MRVDANICRAATLTLCLDVLPFSLNAIIIASLLPLVLILIPPVVLILRLLLWKDLLLTTTHYSTTTTHYSTTLLLLLLLPLSLILPLPLLEHIGIRWCIGHVCKMSVFI